MLSYFSGLSAIEQLLNAVPFTDYMRNLRKEYNTNVDIPRKQQPYIFKDKKYQTLEELYRLSKKPSDFKEVKVDTSIHEQKYI